MTLLNENASISVRRYALIVGVAIILVLFWWMTRWTGDAVAPVTAEGFYTLLTSLPLAGLWLAAAIGFGWPLQRWLAPRGSMSLQTAFGVAAMLLADAGLGALGALTHPIAAWGLIICGCALLIAQACSSRKAARFPPPHGILWTSSPAIAVLLIAACSAPGWLWASEFAGYDALSYHLQLPKEWLHLGRMQPLEHNVYSFLPGYVEAAYLHMMSLRGDSMSALGDCQMLHALLTLASALLVGNMVSRWTTPVLGFAAAALYLATPWIIVVGSLAYNEMAVNLLLAGALLVVFDEDWPGVRRGIAIGILSAAACGAKLTSVGFVIAPLVAALVGTRPRLVTLTTLVVACLTGLLGLAPWLVRNEIYAGNPVFPFLTGLFGHGHWSAEQVETWRLGHMPDAGVADRLTGLWRQYFVYGFGSNPSPGEPWVAQWSVLPWLGLIGGCVAMSVPHLRRIALILLVALAVQLLFWLSFTHLQSRFLVPTSIMLSALAALGAHVLITRITRERARMHVQRLILPATLVLLGLVPLWVYSNEGAGSSSLSIGTVDQRTGEALSEDARHDLGSQAFPAVAVNWLLPDNARVLLIGESTPLYYDLERIEYVTVWDRGHFSRVMAEHGDDPDAVCQALRENGFTHVLVHPTMLAIWQKSGWSDPVLSRMRVIDIFERAAEPLFDYPKPSEISIYALPE